jgi:hypothetical protein
MQLIKKLFTNKYFVLALWFGLSFIGALKEVLIHQINNYQIYKYTFFNLTHQQNLFTFYPQFFEDKNHYGPVFALIIAPFSLLPDSIGVLFWDVFNSFVLYKAISLLPISPQKQVAIFLICAHELLTASLSVQVNPFVTAIIILSFIFIKNEKEFWAAFMIVLGTYIKLYGIVGLAFFFFSDHKIKFTLSMVFWAIVLFALPMLLSSPHFVVQCYHDWYHSLSDKDIQNSTSTMQDISVRGMIRRIFNVQLSDFFVLIPGIILFLSSYIRFNDFKNKQYQLLILSSTLIFPIIFSSSSESPTYIIAFVGVAIWFINLDRPVTSFEWFLLIFALIITSLSPSDLFPKYISTHLTKKYGLKALPCLMIWLRIIYETWTRNFDKETTTQPVLTT